MLHTLTSQNMFLLCTFAEYLPALIHHCIYLGCTINFSLADTDDKQLSASHGRTDIQPFNFVYTHLRVRARWREHMIYFQKLEPNRIWHHYFLPPFWTCWNLFLQITIVLSSSEAVKMFTSAMTHLSLYPGAKFGVNSVTKVCCACSSSTSSSRLIIGNCKPTSKVYITPYCIWRCRCCTCLVNKTNLASYYCLNL